MSLFVEADSLSTVTAIAANPPSQPDGEPRPHEGLVLYISRIPGTKDIILTTLKPRSKNVTAEDVASSLYYAHLDVPEDALFLESLKIEEEISGEDGKWSGEEVEEPPSVMIPRKPLPSTPNSVSDPVNEVHPPPPLPRRPSDSKPLPMVSRKPVPSLPANFRHRQPLEPRPLPPTPSNSAIPTLGSINSSTKDLKRDVEIQPHHPSCPSDEFPWTHEDNSYLRSFSVTLIRRDPATSAQWNIAKISSNSSDWSDHLPNRATKPKDVNLLDSILVQLDTPGYAKFTGSANDIFCRHIIPEYSSSKDNSYSFKSTKSGLDEGFSQFDHSLSHSTSNPRSPSSPTKSSRMSRPKGFYFNSPWNGRCEFFTTTGGRGIKCRHLVSGTRRSTDGINDPHAPSSALVSELRFNLPSTNPFRQSGVRGGPGHVKKATMAQIHHMRNKLSSDRHRMRNSSSPVSNVSLTSGVVGEEEEEDRLDLSLGQEKAGGGSKGKKAKLGKLIIYDEGLKMLDLVVAANLGVWWRTWES